MKRYNEAFDALYDQYTTPEENMVREEADTHRRVLQKAGLAPPRRMGKRGRRVLLAAAVLATAAVSVAAAVYTANDAFRGVLEVHDSAGGTSVAEPVLDRTGSVFHEEEQTGDTSVTLRAAVGDEHTISVLVDFMDTAGSPLAIAQPDGTLSSGAYSLGRYQLTKGDGEPLSGSASHQFLNSGADNRMTLLLTFMVSENILGEPLQLHIEDLLQHATLNGIPLAMEEGALYSIVSGFGPYGEGDFRLSDYNGETDTYGYQLDAGHSAQSVPLSNDVPGVRITGATVRDGSLYLQGIAASADEADRITDNAVLVHATTGAGIRAAAWGQGDSGSGSVPFSVRFDGVESLETLRELTWYVGAGEGFHTAVQGSWDFRFQVEAEDLSVKLTPHRNVVWEDHALNITALELSPYHLYLSYSTDEATALRMFPPREWHEIQTSPWMESERPLALHMRDGSVVTLTGGGLSAQHDGTYATPDTVATHFDMWYMMDAVIDPAQVASIVVGDQTIPVTE